MNTQQLSTVFLVSTLALAGIGISYSGFTDNLNIFGTVQTATVEFNIESYSGTWVWKVWGDGYQGVEIFTYHGDVGTEPDADDILAMPEFSGATNAELISYAYARAADAGDPDDYDIILEFDNLFPSVDFVADFVFTIGSIPVKVNNIIYAAVTGIDWLQPLIDDGYIYATMWDQDDNEIVFGSQIHPDDIITVEVHINIPQDNDFQGKSGTGAALISIVQWTDECDDGQLDDKIVNLPEFTVTMTCSTPGYLGPSYWDHVISGIGPEGTGDGDGPYNIWDDTWVGWCVSETTYIVPGQPYTIDLMSSYDPDNPWAGHYSYSWPCVNYIINNKPMGATWEQIQNAIWYFIDGGYSGSDPVVLDLIDDAVANGQDFQPDTGQLIAVLCIPNPDFQHGYVVQKTFIEVDP